MRKAFRHYFRPTEDALRELWNHAVFSFDASVLLNVYGYSHETREELINFLETNASRLRLPYQFGIEYSRNRCRTIIKQVKNYRTVEEELTMVKTNYISPQRDHPYLSNDALNAYNFVLEELGENRSAMEKLIGSDDYCERLLKAFEGNVGARPSPETLDQLHAEAKERYAKQVPPGYLDLKKKDIPDAYGDFIAWRQLIQIAQDEKRGMILVTDDFKGDWWYTEGDRTLGPRPELLEEFSIQSGQEFCLYTSEFFLRSAKKFMATDIQEHVIEEVSRRLESQRETARGTDLKPATVDLSDKKQVPIEESDVKPSEDAKSTAPHISAADSGKLRPESQ
jgi:hypothetical protein